VPVTVPDSGGGGGAVDAPNGPPDVLVPPTAGDLAGVTAACAKPISADLASSYGRTVQVCQLSNAIFWTSGLAVLCAGKVTATCNDMTDMTFQNSTTALDSKGEFLDAAALPYVEVSAPTSKFDYTMFQVKMGTVVAVIDRNNLTLEYGIVGTVGQPDIIGDASYAMAKSLGIPENPNTGGRPSNSVTYIAFNNPGVAVTINEDHAEAVRLGQVAAAALVQAGK
jgi:hypothetical protein